MNRETRRSATRSGAWASAIATALVGSVALSPLASAGEAVVERGDLTIRFDRKARVEAPWKRPVRFEPEVFQGRLQLASPARAPGEVKAGDLLVELVGREFEDQFEDAQTLAAEAERRLEVQRQERRIAIEQSRLAVDRAEFAAAVAQRTLEIFQSHESAKQLEQRAISFQWQQDALKDERQELAQLEKMYQGTSLAEETKDIVLERARRALARTERQSQFWEQDYRNFVEIQHPQEAKRVEEAARFSAFDLEVARVNARLSGVRAELDLAAAERGVRDARRRADRLERDRERLSLRAPVDGYWIPQVREEGDSAQPWQNLGEVVAIGSQRLRGTLDPTAVRVIGSLPASERRVTVRFPSRPELSGRALITELVFVGSPEGDSTAFPFVATIESIEGSLIGDAAAALVETGIEALVLGERTWSGVLLVPEKAVRGAPARPMVTRLVGEERQDVPVRIGPTVDGKTVVVEGLSEGDRVVTPDG
ncbi:MAG: hypothetical protein KF724_05335 [Phycisphaeraceae bacterium]|nr:hypothetical protein [Phycisphaeraceae bacterium]